MAGEAAYRESDTIGQTLTSSTDKVQFDLQEIQRRMDENPIPNPECARVEKARLDAIARAEYDQQKAQDTINELKGLFA